MAGPETNYLDFESLEQDQTAFRPKPAPTTYVETQELQRRLKPIHLEYGESPFGPPKEYSEIRHRLESSGAFIEAGSHYEPVDNSPAIDGIRKRYNLSENESQVFLSGGGSDEIIERLLWELPTDTRTRIFALGPCFPNIINFAKRFKKGRNDESNVHTGIIATPLDTTLSDTLDYAYEVTKRGPQVKKTIFYLNNPGSPKGDTLSIDELRDFSRFCTDKNYTLIVDEAFGDALPDENSAIPLTQENPHMIVLRSLSKVVGLPGERIGYAAMSPLEGEKFERVRRPIPTMTNSQQLVANEILQPEILTNHLERVRQQIRKSKEALVAALAEVEVSIMPTDMRTPILTIDGETDSYYSTLKEIGVATARGSGFHETHYDLTDRYVRLTVPKNLSRVNQIAERLRIAKRIVPPSHPDVI